MLCVIILGGFAALVYFIRQAARAAAENDRMKEVLDDIEKADKACTDLERDPDAARRVRERFTR